MNKKIKLLSLICIIFSMLYLIFAALPLSKELEFTPLWTVPLTSPSEVNLDEFDNAISFKLGQNLGYFTVDGKILHNITFPYKASISSTCPIYSIYKTDSPFIELKNMKEKGNIKIDLKGFPYIHNDEIYVFLPGGASFAKCSKEGEVLWIYENYAPITAFSSTPNGCAFGLADGSLYVLDKNGIKQFDFAPGGSDYSVILGTALSDSANFVACISGQDKQRFSLAKNDKGHIKVLFHNYLEKQSTRQLFIKFSRNERYVFFDYEGGLGIVDTKELKIAKLSLPGNILSIKESEADNIFFILSKHDGVYTISAFEPFDNFAGSFSYNATNSFIEVKDDALFIGKDSSISKLKVIHH